MTSQGSGHQAFSSCQVHCDMVVQGTRRKRAESSSTPKRASQPAQEAPQAAQESLYSPPALGESQ